MNYMNNTIIGRVVATEKNPTTIDDFTFWTDPELILNPFDIVKVQHVNNSFSYGVIEDIAHITDTLPGKDAHNLTGGSPQRLQHGNFTLALHGHGEHHRHDAEARNQRDNRKHKAHHHALIGNQLIPLFKTTGPGGNEP